MTDTQWNDAVATVTDRVASVAGDGVERWSVYPNYRCRMPTASYRMLAFANRRWYEVLYFVQDGVVRHVNPVTVAGQSVPATRA